MRSPRARAGRLLRATLLGVAACGAVPAHAGPQGAHVTSGSGQVTQMGTSTTIQQNSQVLDLNWQSFNIGKNETVTFVQPNAAAIAVNRILDPSASEIFGHLNANGQVWLINPNGIVFGEGSQINVGGLVASTLDVQGSGAGGTQYFGGNGTGSITNRGTITAAGGGYVALLGNQVSNEGVISAQLGTVAEAGGSATTLTFSGNKLLQVQVAQSTLGNLAQNHGLLSANGGIVYMTAGARDSVLASSVNNSGIISATSVENRNGTIVLLGGDEAGTVSVAGRVDVSSPQGSGGQITVTAHSVDVGAGADLNASGAAGGGAIHVGGGWQGGEDIAQALTVNVAATANLNASATHSGDGGEITVRSDVDNTLSSTRVAGSLDVDGGAAGGNGGRAETSGHWLDVSGIKISASASVGKAGEWLLDPQDVTIAATGTDVTGAGTISYVPTATSTITASSIATALEGGTNVTITTGTTGTSLGDITVASPITKVSGNSNVTLTLQAADSIIVNAPISNTGGTGKLNLQLFADNNNGVHDGVGVVILNQSLSSGGGFISFGNGATATVNGAANTLVGGDVYVGGSSAVNIATAGGAVAFNGQMLIANTSGLNIDTFTGSATGGNVLFAGTIDSGDTYAFVNTGNLTWTAALTAAKSGVGGAVGDTYLATLTSRLENSVAGATAHYNASWLGGERLIGVGTDTTWRWVTGPEGLASNGLGLPFFTQNGSDTVQGVGGTPIGSSYSNWNGGEPNNFQGTNLGPTGSKEWSLQFVGSQGQWNDLNPTSNSLPYVKETNLAPSPLTVNAGGGSSGGTVTFDGAIGKNKPLASLVVTAQTIDLTTASSSITTTGALSLNGQVNYNGNPVNPLYVRAPSITTTYGATLPTLTATYSGFVNGDDVSSLTSLATVSTTGSTAHVSSAAIVASGAADTHAGANYLFLYDNGALLVNPAPLTVSGTLVTTKFYDGTTAATLTGGSLQGVFAADSASLTLSQSGMFTTPNAGTNIAVTVSDLLSGSAAGNYVLTEPTGVTGIIDPKALTVSGTIVGNKVYDTTTAAALSGGTLSGVLAGDLTHVTLTQSGNFATKNAGTGIAVTATDALSGSSAGNYSVTEPLGLTADITPAPVTVTGSSVTAKTYDGTLAAFLSGGVLNGVFGADSAAVTLAQSGTYASKNVGSNIGVTATDQLTGAAASNYALSEPVGLSGSIGAASLTVGGTVVATKTYDGTTSASLSGGALLGVQAGDAANLSLTQSGVFASPNAGAHVALNVTDVLGGSAAGNYVFTEPTGVTGTIDPKNVIISGTTVGNKIYDGTTLASLSGGVLSGVLSADAPNVSLSQSGHFAGKNVGTGLAVSAGDTLTGSAAANYQVVQPGGLTANITPATLTVSGSSVSSKTYDGTTMAALAGGVLHGVVGGDGILLQQTGIYASRNVGSNIAVTATESLSGNGASNYLLIQPTGLAGAITPAQLTVSGTVAAPKTYDGTTAATLSGGVLNGVVSTDTGSLTLTQTGVYVSKNAGTAIGVTVTDALSGSASGNYVLDEPTHLNGTINPASLLATANPVTVDLGDAAPGFSGTLTGFVNGETLATLAALGYRETWMQSIGKGSTATQYGISGAFSDPNYSVVQAAGNATAETLIYPPGSGPSPGGQYAGGQLTAIEGNAQANSTGLGTALPMTALAADADVGSAAGDAQLGLGVATDIDMQGSHSAQTSDAGAQQGGDKRAQVAKIGGRRLIVVDGGLNSDVGSEQ